MIVQGGVLMKVVLIYAHPNPMSFNAAIAAVVREELEKGALRLSLKIYML